MKTICTTYLRPLFMLLLLVSVSACFGGRSAKDSAIANKEDITRPPETIGAKRKIQVETNPDETISFEEWKRRQELEEQEEQAAQAEE